MASRIYSIDVMDMKDAVYAQTLLQTFATFKIDNIQFFFYKPEEVERLIWALTAFRIDMIKDKEQYEQKLEAEKQAQQPAPVDEDEIPF